MKNVYILLALFLFSFPMFAQKGKIVYVVPDSVEVLANQHIQEILLNSGKKNFYFLLETDTLNIYRLTVIPFDKKDKGAINPWVFTSNRFININNRQYPILTTFDFKFATTDPLHIGEYGIRDGNVKRANLITHNYTIFFINGSGGVVKVENY